jgi:hypothetical protein
MNLNYKYKSTGFLLLFLLMGMPLLAQLYPGDANNNGRVDNIDILYIGYAYGTFGPSRITTQIAFDEQNIPLLWNEWFPNGTNYAFADSDGDGLVGFMDMSVVFLNYAEEADIVDPATFIVGDPDIDPVLALAPVNTNNITAGSVIEIPIILGTPQNPITDINGIAFSVLYDHELVSDISVAFTTDSWLNENQGLMTFQHQAVDMDGRIDVGLSRFGEDPVSGEGEIGVVSIVIEEDLISLLPASDSAEVWVELTEIVALNGDFDEIVIAGDSSEMMVYHPDALTNVTNPALDRAVQVFPNPAQEEVRVTCPYGMDRLEVFDLLGRTIQVIYPKGAKQQTIRMEEKGTRVQIIKVYTPRGIISRRVLVENKS